MASKKIADKGNSVRSNGKAWKKNPQKAKVRTPERQEKDFWIRMERARRRDAAHNKAEAIKAAEAEILANNAAVRLVAIAAEAAAAEKKKIELDESLLEEARGFVRVLMTS